MSGSPARCRRGRPQRALLTRPCGASSDRPRRPARRLRPGVGRPGAVHGPGGGRGSPDAASVSVHGPLEQGAGATVDAGDAGGAARDRCCSTARRIRRDRSRRRARRTRCRRGRPARRRRPHAAAEPGRAERDQPVDLRCRSPSGGDEVEALPVPRRASGPRAGRPTRSWCRRAATGSRSPRPGPTPAASPAPRSRTGRPPACRRRRARRGSRSRRGRCCPGSITQNSLPSGSARTTCPSSGSWPTSRWRAPSRTPSRPCALVGEGWCWSGGGAGGSARPSPRGGGDEPEADWCRRRAAARRRRPRRPPGRARRPRTRQACRVARVEGHGQQAGAQSPHGGSRSHARIRAAAVPRPGPGGVGEEEHDEQQDDARRPRGTTPPRASSMPAAEDEHRRRPQRTTSTVRVVAARARPWGRRRPRPLGEHAAAAAREVASCGRFAAHHSEGSASSSASGTGGNHTTADTRAGQRRQPEQRARASSPGARRRTPSTTSTQPAASGEGVVPAEACGQRHHQQPHRDGLEGLHARRSATSPRRRPATRRRGRGG